MHNIVTKIHKVHVNQMFQPFFGWLEVKGKFYIVLTLETVMLFTWSVHIWLNLYLFTRHFDKDKTGYLDHQEFKSCLRSLGYDLSIVEEGEEDPEFEAILRTVDPNGWEYETR